MEEKLVDCRELANYYCRRCSKSIGKYYSHEQHIIDCLNNYVKGVDYIECRICKFAGKKITLHIERSHGLSKLEYINKFPGALLICKDASKNYSLVNKYNGNWIQRKKDNGENLSSYKELMSYSVSNSILNNSKECKRRSILLSNLNKRDDFRKRSSETAKKTSKRPEIIKQRTKNLLKGYKTSKPEKWLLNYLQINYPNYNFKGNKLLKNESLFKSTKTGTRQIDIISESHKIIIEIDGWLHFYNVPKWNQLELQQYKDVELNNAALQLNYTIIRIFHGQWNHEGEMYKSCINKLNNILNNQLNNQLYIIK
jgi:very-short-patch-repair endonuclease